jgi:hypothetical protein
MFSYKGKTQTQKMAESVPDKNKVKYEFLGRSGLKVANISLGCMTFGESNVSLQ